MKADQRKKKSKGEKAEAVQREKGKVQISGSSPRNLNNKSI